MRRRMLAAGSQRQETGTRRSEGVLEEGIQQSLKKFTPQELDWITSRRIELMRKGLPDWEICRRLALELPGRPRDAIYRLIRRAVTFRKLEENPNRMMDFSEEDVGRVISRRAELIEHGLTENAIAERLATELDRSAQSIAAKIRLLIRDGALQKNPNRRSAEEIYQNLRSMKRFSEEEIALLGFRRKKLMKKGLTDEEIARELTEEIRRDAQNIAQKIRSLVSSGRLEMNPNKERRFSDEEVSLIKRRRLELSSQGLPDRAISGQLAKELKGWNLEAIYAKIRQLIKSGELRENPNKRKIEYFDDREIEVIKSTRAELIPTGLTDNEIAKALAKKLKGRTIGTIAQKISYLVRTGQLPPNPNKKEARDFEPDEIDLIKSRRKELMKEHLTDFAIARKLAKELEGRSAGSIEAKIKLLIQEGKLRENPNKRIIGDFRKEEMDRIKARRKQLIKDGLTDAEIAGKLVKELKGRTKGGIHRKIKRSIKSGELPENPNKWEFLVFTEAEERRIVARRQEWMAQGLLDNSIAKKLSRELKGRSAGAIKEKIRRMIQASKLEKNPNKKERKRPQAFSDKEVKLLIHERARLIRQGLTDEAIARALVKKLKGRTRGSIVSRLRSLIREGKIRENPNKKIKKSFSEDEVRLIITKRTELMRRGLTDGAISIQLARQFGRNSHGIVHKIAELIKAGRLGTNPNKQVGFSEDNIALLITRRNELMRQRLTDRAIAKQLASEMKRTLNSIYTKIRKLVKDGRLEENTNSYEFTAEEIATIRSRRAAWMKQGLTDGEISKLLAEELNDRSAAAINEKIKRLIEAGKLRENPNKRKRENFSEQELALITLRRNELMQEGLSDQEIARQLAKELDWRKAGSLHQKIRQLVTEGELEENTNKKMPAAKRLLHIIRSQRRAQALVKMGLQAEGRYLRELVERLLKLFPRIKITVGEAARIIEEDRTLGEFLGRTRRRTKGMEPVLSILVDENLIRLLVKDSRLADLVYKITRDSVAPDFDKDPNGVLQQLRRRAAKERHAGVREIIQRIVDHYSEIVSYDIPGVRMRTKRNA